MNKIQAKLDEIHNDLEFNVTKVYGRRLMLMTYDLAWHSVISFDFDGKRVSRGFLDVLIIGEPRCGKSEMVNRMQEHFNMGEIITGENVSKAGLVGGVNITDNSKMIIWGKYPRNNGRLVVTDEYSNLDIETIAALSAVRSSGVAEINKIISGRAEAMTRKISISNPRTGNNFDSVEYPIMLVKNLIGRDEDIARFDVILGVRQNDMTAKDIAQARKVAIPHVYTKELCNWLLQWTWDLTPEQVRFTPKAVDAVYDVAEKQIQAWSSPFPMIVGPEQHERVARLCAALAARLFTFEEKKLIIREEHVEVIKNYMEKIYTHNALEYHIYAQRMRARSEQFASKQEDILSGIKALPFSTRVLKLFLDNYYVNKVQLEDEIHELTPGKARKIISSLSSWGLITRGKRGYVKTESFNRVLRSNFTGDLNSIHFDEEETC